MKIEEREKLKKKKREEGREDTSKLWLQYY
jgi:hypothetical protein